MELERNEEQRHSECDAWHECMQRRTSVWRIHKSCKLAQQIPQPARLPKSCSLGCGQWEMLGKHPNQGRTRIPGCGQQHRRVGAAKGAGRGKGPRPWVERPPSGREVIQTSRCKGGAEACEDTGVPALKLCLSEGARLSKATY